MILGTSVLQERLQIFGQHLVKQILIRRMALVDSGHPCRPTETLRNLYG